MKFFHLHPSRGRGIAQAATPSLTRKEIKPGGKDETGNRGNGEIETLMNTLITIIFVLLIIACFNLLRHKADGLYPVPPECNIYVQDPKWTKPYGWYDSRTKRIDVYLIKWVPEILGLRGRVYRLTRNHEVLHAWGNPGCSNPFCLGYEGATWREYLAMPLQLLGGLRFCRACRSYLPVAVFKASEGHNK